MHMSSNKLSDTQTAILKAAAKRSDGNIEPLPATLKGGARQKVIEGLAKRKLTVWQSDVWLLTDAGYAAVGRARPQPAPDAPSDAQDAPSVPTVAKGAKHRRTREGSKQSVILTLLARPEGTTLAEIMDATGWQAHSVRGTLSIIGKTQPIASEKSGNTRTYRLANGDTVAAE
jgi:hypothetical protein